MPAQPAWFHRLDEILGELHALPTPFLDRQAVEKLFHVGQRRARQLLEDLPALRIGNALAVERSALIAKLEGVAQSEDYQREQNRQQRVSDHLDQARKHLAARSIRVPAAAATSQRLKGLSSAIEIKPGQLHIRFSDAENLAALLFELSQAMAHDWNEFQEALKAPACPDQ